MGQHIKEEFVGSNDFEMVHKSSKRIIVIFRPYKSDSIDWLGE